MRHIFKVSKLEGCKIEFNIDQIPGCCGVSVIYSVGFHGVTEENKHQVYDYFYNELIMGGRNKEKDNGDNWGSGIQRDLDIWKVNKFVLTDRVYAKSTKRPTLFGFLEYIGAEKGAIAYNPNSGNRVQTFSLTRPEDKYNQHNGEYFEEKQSLIK